MFQKGNTNRNNCCDIYVVMLLKEVVKMLWLLLESSFSIFVSKFLIKQSSGTQWER